MDTVSKFSDGSFILPDQGNNIIRTIDINFEEERYSIGKLFFDKMKSHKNAVAQIDVHSGEHDTYDVLLTKSIRIALAMKEKGIKPDDVICYCTLNERDSTAAYIAGLFLGAVVCSLHPLLPPEDIKYLLSQVTPTMIFCIPSSKVLLMEVVKSLNTKCEIIVLDTTDSSGSFATFLKPKSNEANFLPYIVEDINKTAAIFFSSGTTGLPKGICLNHVNLVSKANLFIEMGYDTAVTLTFATLYWISTLSILSVVLIQGRTRLLCNQFNPQNAVKIIDKYKVTFLFAAVVHVKVYINALKPDTINLPHLSRICIAGAYASETLCRQLQSIFKSARIAVFFAMTETGGIALAFSHSKQDNALLKKNPSSCGRPMPGVWYKVVDIETEKPLGPNQPGELRLKTKHQLNGYYKLDSTSAWDSDRWLKTGDLVYYDDDFCFQYVDRLKEMIRYHLWQIPSGLLVEILERHPAVKQAVVIGIPHYADGEHPLGVVALKENATVTSEELQKFVDDQVDDTKKLRGGVKFVDNIPITPTGKVKKTDLKKMLNIPSF